ncbi:hypothetical protein BGZ46_001523 [Entomortierella lignicola]|nr:hypothetical protein BGZ46_001523 [Entomortierella lignicola]
MTKCLVLSGHISSIYQPPVGLALSSPNVIYPILYMLAIVSVFSLCADAMYHRNQIQVVAFTFFNFLCFAYGIIQTTTDWQALKESNVSSGSLKAFDVAIAATVGVCSLFLAFAAYKLAAVFGWEMYRFLGADLNMRRMHKGYEILITLLKFDVFFFVAFAIQMFTLVDTTGGRIIATLESRNFTLQQLLIGLSIPASIILLALAFLGVMKENRVASIFVMICLLAGEPYFIYQLVYIRLPGNIDRYRSSLKYLTFFISVTMILVLVTLFFMIYCFRNFGKGLLISNNDKIAGPRKPFEIDEDPTESEPSIPMEIRQGEDGASQRLMAYPALKKIQENYHIPSANGHARSKQQYNDKMEIDKMSSYSQLQEDYALNPKLRSQLVKDTTPSTEEHYLYRLRYLSQLLQTAEVPITSQVIDEATELLKLAENSNVITDSDQLEQLRAQIALLAFPVKSDILLKQLNLDPGMNTINQAITQSGEEGDGDLSNSTDDLSSSLGVDSLPTSLDQSIIKTEVLTENLMDLIRDNYYSIQVPKDAWPHLLAQPRMEVILDQLDLDQLFHLFINMDITYSSKSLEIIGRADTSRFDYVVVKIIMRLYHEKRIDFTDAWNIKQFHSLTQAQLDVIKKEDPEKMMNNEGFVGLLEQRIVPELFPEDEENAKKEWLDRMLTFVDQLSPKFNLHKLSVYFLSLQHDMTKGIMDKQKFLKYVAIPRNQTQYNQATLLRHDRDQLVDFTKNKTLQFWSRRVSPPISEHDDELMKEYLNHFMKEAKSSAEFEEYFEVKSFLTPMLAKVMLASGDKDVAKWSGLLPANENLAQLTEKTILKFVPSNPTKFLPSDPVVFRLRAKNAKRILVRVFEIKTFEYLQHHNGEIIGQNLNLDGLTPNWEHNLNLDRPPLEIHEILIELPELSNRRGAFIMDVISNGENSSAYFTKGCLDFIEKQSVAGHVITVIDENQEKLSEKCTIWLNGYYYKPNGDGDIIIPYRKPSSSSSSYIYLIHDGFTTQRPFNHRVEGYDLKLACHIDHESFVAGTTAKIIIKPNIQIQDNVVICPVSLLERVQLTIDCVDANSISTTTTVSDFKVYDVDWSEYNFQVPENLSDLHVTLTGRIKVISTGEHQALKASRSFTFGNPDSDQNVSFEHNGSWQTAQVPGEIVTLLQKRVDGYRVLALGRNGEKRPGIPLEFVASHPIWTKRLNFYLRTDDNGQVYLGPLHDIDSVACTTSKMRWQISGREQHAYSNLIHGVEGEHISLPFRRKDIGTIRKTALFSISTQKDASGAECVLADHTDNLRMANGLLTIKGLKAGYYTFRVGDIFKSQIVVACAGAKKSKIMGLEDFVIGSNPMLEILESSKNPLCLTKPVANAGNVDIQLYNWTPETRVCVISTKFVPFEDTVFDHLKVIDNEVPWSKAKTELTPISFRTGRVLGEEYQYILNRKTHISRWAGNLLTKPSALLSPWSIAETTVSKELMQSGSLGNTETCRTRSTARKVNGSYCSRALLCSMSDVPSRAPPLLHFLVHPSVVLVNLIPDPITGLISIPYETFMEGTFLQIFAIDGFQAVQHSFVVPRPSSDPLEFQRRDLRFKSQLIHTNHYIGERTGVELDPKLNASNSSSGVSVASVTLASSGGSSSAVRVINSISQVYDLMLTLLPTEHAKQTLREFGIITDWHRLTDATKRDKLSKLTCHELHLFLYKKDRAFFDTAIAPFLKSFMDDYLIGASLEKYVSLNEFKRLTCMEKCLLAQRIPSLKPAVIRWIKDRIHNARQASNVKLFLTVMNSGGLKESAPGGGGGGASGIDGKGTQPAYIPTAPAYNPTSPGYSPTSPAYSPVSSGEKEESDDDMGFGLFDGDEILEAANAITPAPPPPRPLAAPLARACLRTNTVAFRDRERSEKIIQRQFKPVDLTKEMAETHYYGRQDFKASDDDEVNPFWLDLVQWDESKGGSFLSQNFVANAGSFTDAMATIALLDVTFQPKDALLTRTVTHNLVISSQSPAIIFHSSTKELTEVPVAGSVLVTQQYFEQTEKTRYDEVMRSQVRHYIQPETELKPLESYGAHVVLMIFNGVDATPNPMMVHLEVQIPHGSISVNGSLESGQDIQLAPHGNFQYEYGFYFPEEGDFAHYPAHVSNYEDVIAFAAPAILKVRAPTPDRKETDTGTWNYILKHGTRENILAKLESSPLTSLPIDQLLPRLYKDRRFLQQVTTALRLRQEYSERIWRVSLVVKDLELVKEYLMNLPASTINAGDWFTSSIYVNKLRSRLDGSWDNSFQYLEYFPLINARAHKATRNATILNDKFKDQYDHFLKYLSQKADHDSEDLLMLIVYLIAQDRIAEAKEKFNQLNTMINSSSSFLRESFQQIQYDYLWAYISLCVEIRAESPIRNPVLDLVGVQAILNKYRDYPVERWRKMFKDMQSYVDEIEQSFSAIEHPPEVQSPPAVEETGNSNSADEDEGEDDDAPEVPAMVDFKIGDGNIMMVRHRGVREVSVEYYSIDAETMFSASPLTLSEQSENESSFSESFSSSSGEATPFGFSSSGQTSGGTSSSNGNSSNSYRLVKPNGVDSHFVKHSVANDGILMIPILSQFQNTNVIISVSTSPPAATRNWKAYYSQTILIHCAERAGTIKVISKTDGKPIRGGYVKVYAEMKNDTKPVFWKDGYTDLVGRFAYALVSTGAANGSSSSGGGLEDVKRFAVFVDGGREGCVVKTLPVPPV